MPNNSQSHHKLSFLDETRSPVVRFCHRAIFFLVVITMVYSVLAAGTAETWSQGPLILTVVLAAGFWALRISVIQEVQIVFSALGAPMILVGTYAIIRYVLAEVEPIGRSNMLLTVTAVMFFFVVLNDIRHRWQVTVIVWVIVGLGVFASIWGLGQVLRGGSGVAARGPFANPVDLAIYLHLAFAVAGGNFLLSRRSQREKLGLAFAALIMSGALLLTFSPLHWAGWLVQVIVFGVFVIRKRGWHFRWIVAGACSLAVVLIAVLIAFRAMPATHSSVSLSLRALWAGAISIGQRNLWLGSGGGMFPWLYPSHRTVQGVVDHCPNQYLQAFAEYGVAGLVLLLWLGGSFAVGVYGIIRLRDEKYSTYRLSNRYAFAVTGLAAIVTLAVDSLIHLDLRVGGIVFPLLAVMATALTCGIHRRLGQAEQTHLPGRSVAVRLHGFSRFVLVAGLAGLAVLIATRLRKDYPAEVFLRRGRVAMSRLDWNGAERNFLRAWKFDKRSFATAEAIGDLYLARATWNQAERETLAKEAQSWYYRVKTLNSYNYDIFTKSGRLYELQGQTNQALEAYRSALDNDPRNASYQIALGQYYARQGNAAHAQRSFRIARELDATEILPPD